MIARYADTSVGKKGTKCANDGVGGPFVSVIIPVFNEVGTIAAMLDMVAAESCGKQIIIVDDGSTDGTWDVLRLWKEVPGVVLLRHDRNRGKGRAIRTGLNHVCAPFTLIQDADLEYDPQDYSLLLEPLSTGVADVVYGSRYLEPNGTQSQQPPLFRAGVKVLNLGVRFLYKVRITDEATCYKAFRTDLLRRLDLQCERFEFCPEVTAKLCRLGIRIHEVPIHYRPRSYSAGKKIRLRDGWEAVRTLWKYRRWQPTTQMTES